MDLDEITANKIVERAFSIIRYPINVMNKIGIIIASSDVRRINTKHEGAIKVLNENCIVEIDEQQEKTLNGVKEGINLPILFKHEIIGVVGISGPLDEIRDFGQLLIMTAELIIEHTDVMSKIHIDKRYRENLLNQLINQKNIDMQSIVLFANHLQYDLSTNKVVAIFKIKNADKLSTEVFQKIIDIIEHFDKHLLVGVLSFIHHEIVILKNVKVSTYKDSPEIAWFKRLVDRIEEHENVHVRLAIGGIFDGVCGIDKSYKTARIALENHSDSRKKIIFYGQDPIKYLISELANTDWKLEQFRQPLSAIEKNDVNLSLLNTLKVYFDQNCDQTSTCESLRIHRNTLRYRLARIEEMTSLKINKLNDLLSLYIAVNYFK